jgi:hypothetical protein
MEKVVISPNIVKTSERIDMNGNVINPRTKEVIVPKESDIVYIPPPTPLPDAPQAPTTQASPNSGALSILDQIKQAQENLKALEELKQLKIAEKKAELDLLQQ